MATIPSISQFDTSTVIGKGSEQVPDRLKNMPGVLKDLNEFKEMRNALQNFEAMFINTLLKTMRDSIDQSELFHGGSGERIYQSMLDTELSADMSKAGGIGLTDMLLRQLAPESVEKMQDMRRGLNAYESELKGEDNIIPISGRSKQID